MLASIADHAEVARLLRDRLLAMRASAADTAASAVGVRFSAPPADKKMVFMGGVQRGRGGDAPEPISEENRRLAEEMRQSMPLGTFRGWLKQIDAAELNPMGQLALDYAFPFFLTFMDFDEYQAHNALIRKARGVSTFTRTARARRFAGDESLPRGRYYTVCHDSRGDDQDTLQGELWAYYRPERAGDIAMLDSANEKLLREAEERGWWTLPRLSVPYIGIVFAPAKNAPNPFGSLVGVEHPNALSVLLPVSVSEVCVERVLDLRQPEAARWFAYHFSRLVWEPDADAGIRDWVRCCPMRPPLDSIQPLLPTLLTQERGGGVFCQMVGHWLRKHGVNGLVFPSVRNNPSVEVEDGRVTDWHGWNFVDYRNAPEPKISLYVDTSDYWEEKIRVGLGLGVSQLPGSDPYFSASVDFVGEGRGRGSWRTKDIIAVRLALIGHELEQLRAGHTKGQPRSAWIADLPVHAEVREWVGPFLAGNYRECVRRGLGLLPEIRWFEILQMFLISLQRLGKQTAGGGWTADEVLEQLAPQVLENHKHLPEQHGLLAITLGAVDPEKALAATQDVTVRCCIQYYAAARLISQGRQSQAIPYLDACIESAANCLEPHLALVERERAKG